MKYLAIVDYAFPDNPSGSARVAWDYCELARDAGADTTLLCYKPITENDFGLEPQIIDGIRVIRAEKPNTSQWNPRRYERIADAAVNRILDFDSAPSFDTVHIHSVVLGARIVSRGVKTRRLVTTVHSPITLEHEVNWKGSGGLAAIKARLGRRVLRRIEAKVLSSSDIIHTLSDFTKRKLAEIHGDWISPKTEVIPHWAKIPAKRISQTEARQSLGWHPSRTALFSIRNHRPRYGLDIAIKALAPLLKGRQIDFYIGGDGPMRTELEALAHDLDVQDYVHFIGRVNDAELDLAYYACDLFILPTIALECFGLIAQESLARGRPLVATNIAAIPEVAGALLPDSLVAANDVVALRTKVQAYLNGEISFPDEVALEQRVRDLYGKETIVPKARDLITPI